MIDLWSNMDAAQRLVGGALALMFFYVCVRLAFVAFFRSLEDFLKRGNLNRGDGNHDEEDR